MPERQQDLRYQKSEQRLIESLEKLLQQGKIVRISELCRQAGVYKSTFYRHYHDIQELICQKEDQVLKQFDQVITKAKHQHEDLPQVVEDTLIFIYKNRTNLRALSYLDHDKIPLAIMQKLRPFTTSHWEHYAPKKLSLIYHVYSHEVIAILTTWSRQEDFATNKLVRHEHDIIYLTETAVKRLNRLVAD